MASPVDWVLAERLALRFSGTEPFAHSYHAESLVPDFTELTAEAEQLVASETGLRSLAGPARARVVDRADWIRANLASFERLLRPLLAKMEEQSSGRPGLPVSMASKLAAMQVGTLLGWMSGRVLGQYDLLVIDDDTADRQDLVYYVGPNLLSLEKRFGFPPREFRLWIALHECTHRAQFTGVPWMRDYFLGLVHEAVSMVDPDPNRLFDTLKGALSSARNGRRAMEDGGLVHLLATPDQRTVLNKIGGLMSLLEGHGDVTMNRAAVGHVPSAERFARVLRERRRSAGGVARLLQRLLGIEAKLAQYEAGERFIAAIEAKAGRHAIERCWARPEDLPTLDEIRAPEQWLSRLGLATAVA
jgi:coenzyme F420 biosynthesis associated uncharacterized protein